jgi:hypothetical protein
MRPRIIIAGMTLTLAASFAVQALAEDGYRHGRLRIAEPGVSLQRASGLGAEEANANEPFLPGDRVWTNAAGRAEFQFPDGSLVRLDQRSKLDYSGHDEGDGNRIVLRLWSGSLYLRVRARDARFEVETPAGTLRGLERSLVRVDVDAGEARLSVYEGDALFDDTQTSLRLTAGQRAYARGGERISDLEDFDIGEDDAFSRWNADREAQNRFEGRSAQYLPDELDTYAAEFDSYGDWRYEDSVGYVWVPRVAVDWHPYWDGRWCWTPFGWTWIPYEPWGWAPAHYGRWGWGSYGWYWIPDATWGPAWVSWAVGDGYVGWCPLGRHGRPVRDWDSYRSARHERGHAAPRPGRDTRETEAWNVVPRAALGQRNLAERRVSPERLGNAPMQVAASASLRPTRDALGLMEGGKTVRSLSTRPMPGDFVPELAGDNKTLRTPWFRGGTPSSVGAQVRDDSGRSLGNTAGGTRRGSEPASMGATSRTGAPAGTSQETSSGRRTLWFEQPPSAGTRSGSSTQESHQHTNAGEARGSHRTESGERSMVPPPLTQDQSSGGSRSRGDESRPRETAPSTPARSFGSSETPHNDSPPARPRDMGSSGGSSSGGSSAPRSLGGSSSSSGSSGGHSQGGSTTRSSAGASHSSQSSEGAKERHSR